MNSTVIDFFVFLEVLVVLNSMEPTASFSTHIAETRDLRVSLVRKLIAHLIRLCHIRRQAIPLIPAIVLPDVICPQAEEEKCTQR